MSELIIIILLIIFLLIVFLLNYFIEKRGLYYAIVIMNIVTFILSFKITQIFKMNINLGIIPYITTLSIIYIYLAKYGKKEIKNLVVVSLITNVITAIFIAIMNYYIPAITETISINMAGTFEHNYKILIFYPIIMLISQYSIIKLYLFLSTIQSNITLNLILTYIITGIIYTVLFYTISYINILTIKESIFVGITTYIIGIVLTILHIIYIKFVLKSKKVIKWEI